MVGARRFERVGSRKDHRNGTYLRRLLTSLGQIDVMVPRSRGDRSASSEGHWHHHRSRVGAYRIRGAQADRMEVHLGTIRRQRKLYAGTQARRDEVLARRRASAQRSAGPTHPYREGHVRQSVAEEPTEPEEASRVSSGPRPEVIALNRSRWLVPCLLGAWFLFAVGLGGAGVLVDLRPPWPQTILVGLTLLTLTALYRVGPIHSWALRVDPRTLVAFHLTRFVGIYFLVLYSRGELPYEFAVIGGWGDIIVAAAAVPLILTGLPTAGRRKLYLAWNVVGLVDILFVVATATRLALADPTSFAPLLRLPLSLLITFVVPIVIATHVWIFRRIRDARSVAGA